jgi:hypothetical protein
MRTRHQAHPRGHGHQWRVGLPAWVGSRERRSAQRGRRAGQVVAHPTRRGGRLWSRVSTLAHRCRASLRPPCVAQRLGLRASGWPRTLLRFVESIRSPPSPIRWRLCEQVRDHVRLLMGGGSRGVGRPAFPPPPATKGSERAGAGPETLGGQTPGAPGTVVHPATARSAPCATPHRIGRTEPSPGDKLLLGRPWMPSAPHRGEAHMPRWGLAPGHVGAVDAGEPGERGAEGKGRCVAWRLPRRRHWGRQGRGRRIDAGRQRAEGACAVLSAGGALPLGNVRERQRWGARAKMGRPVIPCQRVGDGLWTGFAAGGPIRRSGLGRARPRQARGDSACLSRLCERAARAGGDDAADPGPWAWAA